MTDLIDHASALEQRHRDDAIAAARSTHLAAPQIMAGDTIVCACCGNPIPLKRLALNPAATLCVQCKTELEATEF